MSISLQNIGLRIGIGTGRDVQKAINAYHEIYRKYLYYELRKNMKILQFNFLTSSIKLLRLSKS